MKDKNDDTGKWDLPIQNVKGEEEVEHLEDQRNSKTTRSKSTSRKDETT